MSQSYNSFKGHVRGGCNNEKKYLSFTFLIFSQHKRLMYFCRTILCWWFTINIDTHSWIMHGRDQFKRWEMEVKCQTTSLLKFWTGEARNWFVGRGGWEMRMFSSHCLGYIESSQNKTAPRHEVHFELSFILENI